MNRRRAFGLKTVAFGTEWKVVTGMLLSTVCCHFSSPVALICESNSDSTNTICASYPKDGVDSVVSVDGDMCEWCLFCMSLQNNGIQNNGYVRVKRREVGEWF
jgi:hypothetical protein